MQANLTKQSPEMIWTMNIFTYAVYAHAFLVLALVPKYKLGTFVFLSKTIIPLIPLLLLRKFWLSRITFELSENSVKYRRDFFGVVQKSVRYVDIKEVVLKQSFAQKWYDIGSVEIKVFAAIASPGIELFDLKNYKEVYDFLLEKTNHNPVK
jgi:hypothetical protein